MNVDEEKMRNEGAKSESIVAVSTYRAVAVSRDREMRKKLDHISLEIIRRCQGMKVASRKRRLLAVLVAHATTNALCGLSVNAKTKKNN